MFLTQDLIGSLLRFFLKFRNCHDFQNEMIDFFQNSLLFENPPMLLVETFLPVLIEEYESSSTSVIRSSCFAILRIINQKSQKNQTICDLVQSFGEYNNLIE
jgi:fucose 4-O-acetylase-like acetyltransferase